MTQAKYTVVLLSEGKEGYTAVVPALPGCVTCGETAEVTLAMPKEAIELYIESELEHGEPIVQEHIKTLIGTVDVDVPVRIPTS